MERSRVAIVGAGSSGLTMLKALREDGFNVTLYERRDKVGGLWAYTDNPAYTTALPSTRANLSKFTCGFSDYPMPEKYPTFMQPHEFQEFMHGYATHFDLLKSIVFNATVTLARRNASDTHWLLTISQSGTTTTLPFDRIVFAHGYQTTPSIPTFPAQSAFTGTILHAQAFRSPSQFTNQRVLVVGLSSSSGDIIPLLVPVASKVYVSHRRGALPFTRYNHNNTPNDLSLTWRRRQLSHFMQRYLPNLSRRLADAAVTALAQRAFPFPLDPAWRLLPFPSLALNLPGSFELVVPMLRSGEVTSLAGVKRFAGGKTVEFADGTVVEDVDVVVLCTGYEADWSAVAPWLEESVPYVEGYDGVPMKRLWMNMFPPRYADSCVMLCYSAFGKNNGFSFADVTAWAVSNVWRGVEPLPGREEMERWVDGQQRWVVEECWRRDRHVDVSMVRQWEFQGWLHRAAGTGMEALGWGWKGWQFWWRDREMYALMNHGVETAHAFRYFETGRRRTWDGAEEAIRRVNEVVKKNFPARKEDIEWPPKIKV